jgi:hypothetical protein
LYHAGVVILLLLRRSEIGERADCGWCWESGIEGIEDIDVVLGSWAERHCCSKALIFEGIDAIMRVGGIEIRRH